MLEEAQNGSGDMFSNGSMSHDATAPASNPAAESNPSKPASAACSADIAKWPDTSSEKANTEGAADGLQLQFGSFGKPDHASAPPPLLPALSSWGLLLI